MDNYNKIERLVDKAGCSYEEAKAALEDCGWDMIDAIISLERAGKVKKTAAEPVEEKADEPIEIIPEVTVEKSSGNDSHKNTNFDDETAGDQADAENTGSTKAKRKREFKLWNRIKRALTNNRMVVLRSNDQKLIDLPIWIPVIALIAFFWATLILAVIAMAFGCRFHFEGEDLGRTNINNTMDKATDYAEKVKNDLTGKSNDRQNTDN